METQTEKFLNVTLLQPWEKHSTIFEWFDALEEGEGFILHNDHDPKPLYYQLQSQRGAVFSWDYLQQGPDVYEIRIAKLVLNSGNKTEEKLLDVTKLSPREKHPTIFQWFDNLKEGEGFILHNDHDPKPLYYQLLGERGNTFTWDYLQQGPAVFEIRIAKIDTGSKETVGAISAKDYRKAEVFKKYGIDFCCGGNKTLKEASEEAGITEAELKQALQEAENAPAGGPNHDFDKWDLDFLADYIRQTHHRYVKENAEVIAGLSVKIANHHGVNHPELKELAPRVHHMMEDFMQHMEKEEKVLFAGIKKLAEMERNNEKLQVTSGSISHAIEVMEAEHDQTGDDLRYFRKLTNDYELPSDACNSYTYLFQKLQEFEDDTFRHVHLENNILFPKAIKLEKKLIAQ